MKKLGMADVYNRLAERTGMPKREVKRLIEEMERMIMEELRKGVEIVFTGFGSFLAKPRKGRAGVNPKTRSPMEIPTVVIPKFKAGKNLKEALKEAPEPRE